jgi:hypothetical protein
VFEPPSGPLRQARIVAAGALSLVLPVGPLRLAGMGLPRRTQELVVLGAMAVSAFGVWLLLAGVLAAA